MNRFSRRSFLKTGAAAGFFISASRIYGQEVKAGDQKLRILKVGTGGMGGSDINSLSNCNVIFTGVCDTNPDTLKKAMERFAGVPGDTDYRKLFEKSIKNCDAVCVSTADHTHAIIALEAMRQKKHVYVQKPLAHAFEECEMLMAAEKKYGVVTQMGNQGHPGVYRYERLWEKKFWGDEILEVHSWTDRAKGWWPQGMTEPAKGEQVPNGYNWDCWLGPAANRPYSGAYLPFKWRGWKDFGCGAIGDMAVHNFDPAYWVLDLGLPVSAKAWVDKPSKVAFPNESTIDIKFGPSPKCPKGVMMHWYESKILPKRIPGMHQDYTYDGNGCMIVGNRAATVGGSHAGKPQAVAATGKAFGPETKELQRECNEILKGGGKWDYNHYKQWVDACIANDQTVPGSRFAYAARLTQTLLIGCIAQFFPGQELIFDPKKKVFTNNAAANAMLKCTGRPGFTLRV